MALVLLGIDAADWTVAVTTAMATIALIALLVNWRHALVSRQAAADSARAAEAAAASARTAEHALLLSIPVVIATPGRVQEDNISVELTNHGRSAALDITATFSHTEYGPEGEFDVVEGACKYNAIGSQESEVVKVTCHEEMQCSCIYFDAYGVEYRSITRWFYDSSPETPSETKQRDERANPLLDIVHEVGFGRSVTLHRRVNMQWERISPIG